MSFHKQVTIEYTYVRKDDKVYKKWRFPGQRHWNYTLTPYREIPIVEFKASK